MVAGMLTATPDLRSHRPGRENLGPSVSIPRHRHRGGYVAETTRVKVPSRFVDDQGTDPASPHSYVNRAVLSEMVKRLQLKSVGELFSVDLARLHEAARDVLLEDSRKRAAAQAIPIPTN